MESKKAALHQWTDWEFSSEHSCCEERICAECGQMEHRTDPHAWGKWTTIELLAIKERRCTRCNTSEITEDLGPLVHKLGWLLFNHTDQDVLTIQSIGRELSLIGGMPLMRKVAYKLQEKDPYQASRLNNDWDGIGYWMS